MKKFLIFLAVLLFSSNSYSAQTYTSTLDLTYASPMPGIYPDNAYTLDIYSAPGKTSRGVLVFIHGGGWTEGDKSNFRKSPNAIELFISQGFTVADINFRLPKQGSLPRVTYREQEADIASAIKWLSANVSRYGGDPKHFVLFGYSSGAHLTALASTDKRYFAAQALDYDIIDGVILLDVDAYDIPRAIEDMRNPPVEANIEKLKFLFGATTAEQKEASPITYVNNPGKMPFLVMSGGVIMEGKNQDVSYANSEAFVAALKQNGHEAKHVHFASRSHISFIPKLGSDDEVTVEIKKFLSSIPLKKGL